MQLQRGHKYASGVQWNLRFDIDHIFPVENIAIDLFKMQPIIISQGLLETWEFWIKMSFFPLKVEINHPSFPMYNMDWSTQVFYEIMGFDEDSCLLGLL